MKIILAAGGTAGHINPAISIAELLHRELPNAEILFIGTPNGMENKLVKEAGYRIRHIEIAGLQRRLTLENLKTLHKLLRASRKAREILREERATLVIGTGGYVCYPILRAAASLGIPTAIHESNAKPGLAVRMLAQHVSTVMLGFPSAAQFLKKAKRTVITGNPIRSEFHRLTRGEARSSLHLKRDELLLLSFGGSLGSSTINSAMREAIPRLLKEHPRLRIVHASGMHQDIDFTEENKEYIKAESKRVDVRNYISDIPRHMLAADLLLSRSGAITLSEAAFTGTPSILIPYPHATDDHQTKNALALVEFGAASIIYDGALTADTLTKEISRLLLDDRTRLKMRKRMYAFAPKNAENLILSELLSFFPDKDD